MILRILGEKDSLALIEGFPPVNIADGAPPIAIWILFQAIDSVEVRMYSRRQMVSRIVRDMQVSNAIIEPFAFGNLVITKIRHSPVIIFTII